MRTTEAKGGGRFLDLCFTHEGTQWTGQHDIIERLLALGMSPDRIKLLVPRHLWDSLPGRVPYLLVTGVSPARAATA
jgi:hypothetical protein